MLGEEGAKALCSGQFSSLIELDLRKNFIGNQGLKYLC